MSTTPDERLSRALTAFLRQEVQAPASAVTDFLDMIIEDARAAQSESLLADLERMRGASVQLNAFVKSLIQDTSSDRRKDETFEEFNRRLRHDLRTPLNAIKGYSELLLEDMEAAGERPLRADLAKLKASADQLLGQIDAMAALARRELTEPAEGAARAQQLDLLADVLRTVQPLPAGGAARRGAACEPYPRRRRQRRQSRRAGTPAGARGAPDRERHERGVGARAGDRRRSSTSSCSISSCRK